MSVLPAISARRRNTDRVARTALAAGTVVALVPLLLVVLLLLKKGLGAWSWHFFSSDPTGRFLGDPGGIRSAIVGTIVIVALASALAVPMGIGVALYLVEYGKSSRFAGFIRYLIDVMTGVPSIVFGLFVYTLLVVTHVFGSFAGWKGSLALGLLMLPVVTRAAEVVLNLVPDSLREAALALGAPRWRVIFRVVLPSAASGLVTGSLLAVARAAGETAPLIFTSFAVFGVQLNPGQQMNSLPIQIFNDARAANDQLVERAWGAALTLVTLVLLISIVARLASRRSRLA